MDTDYTDQQWAEYEEHKKNKAEDFIFTGTPKHGPITHPLEVFNIDKLIDYDGHVDCLYDGKVVSRFSGTVDELKEFLIEEYITLNTHKKKQAKVVSGNIVSVIDNNGDNLAIAPPEGFDIDFIYRDDGSLQVFAFNNTDRPRTLAEFAAGAWSSAVLAGGE